jgi:epoxyqueuosine reductase
MERLGDDSPLVRGAAVWAFAQLLSREAFALLADQHAKDEPDSSVAEEWRFALSAPKPLSPR